MISNKVLNTLEYNKILETLATKAESENTRVQIKNSEPAKTYEQAQLLLNETIEANKVLFDFAVNPNFSVDNIINILESAKKMSILSMSDLLKIARVLRVSRKIKLNILKVNKEEIPILTGYVNRIYSNFNLEDDIEKSIISETEMADCASSDLKNIRINIRKCNDRIRAKLNSYTTSSTFQKYLQDNIVTMRGDRYVLPVKSECRSMINGLIHDQSASGATVYIEPMIIVALNNDLATLRMKEQTEISKVLQAFTTIISSESEQIQNNFDIITDLDMIFARSKYGKSIKAVEPILNNDGIIDIKRGKHPLINKDKVVPISVNIGKNFDILLVTGPNTGGKTVTIKLVGLFTLMAMSGMMLPMMEGSKLSFFENVCSDIGDEQSIEQNLSTFSSHMKNITEIIEIANDKSLVLLDELGAGTDPTEGAVLAVSITEYIKDTGAKAIITTHYNELKEYSMTTNRVENASMDFNPKTFEPIYKLIIGVAGSSNALHIAKRLGLKQSIIDNAVSKISKDKIEFENVILSAQKSRKKAENYLDEMYENKIEQEKLLKEIKTERANLQKQQEQLNNKIRKESKKLIEESVEEANDILEKMKKMHNSRNEQDIFTARKMRKQLENMQVKYDETDNNEIDIDTTPIQIDSIVYVKSLKKEGIVEAINTDKNAVRVRLGNITINLKLNEIVKVKKNKTKKKQKKVVNFSKPLNNSMVKSDINVIGQNLDEALMNVEDYLDKAIIAGLTQVTIIHGKGTGVLRKGIQKRLKSHKGVQEFRNGKYGEGETGVTVVTLK